MLKREEQEFDCKRAALVEAAEATITYYFFLSAALEKQISEFAGEVPQSFARKHTALQLFVGIKTVELSNELSRKFGTVAASLLKQRLHLAQFESQIEMWKVRIADRTREMDMIRGEISNIWPQDPDKKIVAYCYQELKKATDDIENFKQQIAELQKQLVVAKIAAQPEQFELVTRVIDPMAELLISIRSELGLDVDERRFRESLQKNIESAKANLNDLSDFIGKMVSS